MKNALILLAGGKGNRFSSHNKIPKQFVKIGNYNIIEYFLNNLDKDIFERIQIVVDKKYIKKHLSHLKKQFPQHIIGFVNSGKKRSESSKKGILSLIKSNPKNVLIHDSARPLVSNKLIKKLLKNLDKHHSCAPFVMHNDYIKTISKKIDVKKDEIIHIQTPQAFRFNIILKAHKILKNFEYDDDTSLLNDINIKTKFIKGEKSNIKITFPEDKYLFKKLKHKEYRRGIGYDIHKINFNSKRKLKLCGVIINHPPLIGHSDADVGYHAICDSILGALSKRDIGFHFSNNNNKWKNIDSKFFLKFCYTQLKKKKFNIINLDINFICEKPKINNYINKMKKNISSILNLNLDRISIKATTNEKVGFIGKGEAIASESIILIEND